MTERETRIWLDGTECELRPISAAGYLSAKKEAAERAKEYGGGPEAERLLFCACLAARGVWAGGERKFESPEAALAALSAEELVFAAAEYALPEIYPKGETAPDGETPQRTEKSTPSAEETPKPKKSGGDRDFMTYVREPGSGAVTVEMRNAPKRHSDKSGGDGETEIFSESLETFYASPSWDGMERTSAFFERDGRRYDGAFERY